MSNTFSGGIGAFHKNTHHKTHTKRAKTTALTLGQLRKIKKLASSVKVLGQTTQIAKSSHSLEPQGTGASQNLNKQTKTKALLLQCKGGILEHSGVCQQLVFLYNVLESRRNLVASLSGAPPLVGRTFLATSQKKKI